MKDLPPSCHVEPNAADFHQWGSLKIVRKRIAQRLCRINLNLELNAGASPEYKIFSQGMRIYLY